MRSLLPLCLLLTLTACSSTQEFYEITEVDRPAEFESDSLQFEAQQARITYVQPARVTPDVAPDRVVDLLSTSLDLEFDFAREAVIGTATHILSPIHDDLNSFYLNAEDMEIGAVRLVLENDEPDVPFEYANQRLTIDPQETIGRGDTITIAIDYTAFPTRGAGQGSLGDGGKGLYFIDAAGTDPYRPTQIWTQGQAESNRRWFPTWDYPNDRMGFEITLTVPDSLVTAANGALVEQTDLGDGLRQDRYQLAGDHVSYLTAVAAGDYAVVRDSVESTNGRTIPLAYFVEPEFREAADRIFGETPAMIRFFETYLDEPYPWQDYKQMAVRDFTAGGMENTTITLLFEWIQTDERAFLDYTGRDLIAHELVHQWFGDVVTTEDWANLALNESFASYFEELYLDAEIGRDEAQAHGIDDRERYFQQARSLRRPIVWYGYDSPSDMFDRHTYQKGAQVLNQLRFELGDETFRRGMAHYLDEHRYDTVELADFREAMEEVSGRSLQRFFDQWFREPGHPELSVEQAYFGGSGVYTVQVVQRQDLEQAPTFAFDVNVELNYPNRPAEIRRVRMASADTTLRFSVPAKPTFVRFNEGNWAFTESTITQPLDETIVQATMDDEMAGRYAAVETLGRREDLNPEVREALIRVVTEDAFPLVRERAAAALAPYAEIDRVRDVLAGIASDDEAPTVRRAALGSLAGPSPQAQAALRAALADPSYLTQAVAVRRYAEHFSDDAFAAFQPLFEVTSWRGSVEGAIIETITRHRLGGLDGARVLASKAGVMHPDNVRLAAINGLLVWSRRDEDVKAFAAATLAELVGDGRPQVRQLVARALGEIGDEDALARLTEQIAVEQDPVVKAALEGAVEQLKKGETQVGSTE